MPRIGPTELIIILVIILIVFGAGRLPEIGGAIGKGIRSFKRSASGEDEGAGDAKAGTTTKQAEEKTKS